MERVSVDDTEAVEAVEGVALSQLAAGDRMSVQHFVIGPGETVPEHSHEHEQAGYLVEGSLVFTAGDEETLLEAGDSYVVAGGVPHGVENRGDVPAKGLDIFSPPRPNPDWED